KRDRRVGDRETAEHRAEDRTQRHRRRDAAGTSPGRQRAGLPEAPQADPDDAERDQDAGRAGGLDVGAKDQHQRRDQPFSAGDSQHALTRPTPTPITKPAARCAAGLGGSRSPDGNGRNDSVINNSPSMPSRIAISRTRRRSVSRLTKRAPTIALAMPPATSPSIAGR